MADTVKRMNYYDHQFLRQADFQAEQNYHMNMRRLHNSTLHTPGILNGLDVTPLAGGSATAVTVKSGAAMDSAGREIVLPADTNLELGGEAVGVTVYITIAYKEYPSDSTTEAGGPGYTRITELPTPAFSHTAPADPNTLILAKVSRTGSGLGTIDLSDRKQAGVDLGLVNSLTVNSLILSNGSVPHANWPTLSCSAANQATFANSGLLVNGNVGIGTTSPTLGKLQTAGVVGSTAAVFASDGQGIALVASWPNIGFNSYFNAGWKAINTGYGGAIGIDEGVGGLHFRTADMVTGQGTPQVHLERMRITNTGNVGIGTTGLPGSRLDVVGGAARTGSHPAGLGLYATADSASNSSGIEFRHTNGTQGIGFGYSTIYATGSNADQPLTIQSRGASAVTLTGNAATITVGGTSGNVGIGTTSPGQKLEVSGGSVGATGSGDWANGFYARSAGGGIATLRVGPKATYPGIPTEFGFTGTDTDLPFVIRANAQPVTTFLTNGSVGIGTTAPGAKLDVRGNVQTQSLSFQDAAGVYFKDNWLGMADNVDGVKNKWLHIGGITDNTDGKGAKRRIGLFADPIFMAGKVGIGTVDPAALLDVGGNSVNNVQAIFTRGADANFQLCAGNGSGNASGSVQATFGLRYAGQGDAATLSFIRGGGARDASLAFNTNGAERLRITSAGALVSPMWRVTQVMSQVQGALPKSATFTSGGGVLMIVFSGSGFGSGNIGMTLQIDGNSVSNTRCYTNEASSHKSFTTNICVQPNISAGNHTVNLVALAGTNTDSNDWFNVTILELPF
jgi:hypothetical protein